MATRAESVMDVKGKRVLVVGLGKSGVASALFLEQRGARVAVSDAKSPEQLRHEIPLLLDHGISVETGQHRERTFRDQDPVNIEASERLRSSVRMSVRTNILTAETAGLSACMG